MAMDSGGGSWSTRSVLSASRCGWRARCATCEMARELLIVDRTAAPLGEGIVATWTDVSGTKYAWPEDKRPIIPHVAQAMLAKFGTLIKRKGGAVKLVRA